MAIPEKALVPQYHFIIDEVATSFGVKLYETRRWNPVCRFPGGQDFSGPIRYSLPAFLSAFSASAANKNFSAAYTPRKEGRECESSLRRRNPNCSRRLVQDKLQGLPAEGFT
jgi:hypothetical protein